jgi:hypothetical protein
MARSRVIARRLTKRKTRREAARRGGMFRSALGPALVAFMACGALSCDLPFQPKSETWNLMFVNQKSSKFGGSSCPAIPSNPYCRTFHDDPHQFAGVLIRRGDRWGLRVTPDEFNTREEAATDRVYLFLRKFPETPDELWAGCVNYTLDVTVFGDSVAGSFSYASDCHGASRIGTVTGHR